MTAFTGVANDGAINIRAIGIDTKRNNESVSMDVAGTIYYESPSLEDLKVFYQVGDGEVQKVALAKYMLGDGANPFANLAVDPIVLSNQYVNVTFEAKDVQLKVERAKVNPKYSSKQYKKTTK